MTSMLISHFMRVLKSFNQKKIVWDDGRSKIGIVVDGRLKVIGKEQIKSIKIVEMHEVVRKEVEKRTVLKKTQNHGRNRYSLQ